MGRDCSIYVFPPSRCYRQRDLDRLRVFHPVSEVLGLSFYVTNEPISAKVLFDAIRIAPIDEDDEHRKWGYSQHWRDEASQFLLRSMKRWGDDVPAMIYEEEWPYGDFPAALHRLERMRASKRIRSETDGSPFPSPGIDRIKWVMDQVATKDFSRSCAAT